MLGVFGSKLNSISNKLKHKNILTSLKQPGQSGRADPSAQRRWQPVPLSISQLCFSELASLTSHRGRSLLFESFLSDFSCSAFQLQVPKVWETESTGFSLSPERVSKLWLAGLALVHDPWSLKQPQREVFLMGQAWRMRWSLKTTVDSTTWPETGGGTAPERTEDHYCNQKGNL